ncbi:hypothetical protein AB1Y20_010028 [Prymnesium parvum]|uniref:Bacterial bifunctional deaminase-reductase C-terminal domain-containing protein n=1 Tax=Prymnesium parvum TaxID=97485 RepID=A0AB34K688_PRYPA
MHRPVTAVYIAASLDGFISRPAGGLDWLPQPPTEASGTEPSDDMGFGAFVASVDGILMGRKTFEPWINGQFDDGVAWPYTKPVTVLSRTLTESVVPERLLGHKIAFTSGDLKEIVFEMGAQGWRKLYVDGGTVINSLLAEDLVDEMTITTVPVLIGDGARLFGRTLTTDLKWDIVGAPRMAADNGMVQVSYRRKR